MGQCNVFPQNIKEEKNVKNILKFDKNRFELKENSFKNKDFFSIYIIKQDIHNSYICSI